eukprot:COSAG01_NODE_25916_length_729_cov_1.266667_1_plen_152_part_10
MVLLKTTASLSQHLFPTKVFICAWQLRPACVWALSLLLLGVKLSQVSHVGADEGNLVASKVHIPVDLPIGVRECVVRRTMVEVIQTTVIAVTVEETNEVSTCNLSLLMPLVADGANSVVNCFLQVSHTGQGGVHKQTISGSTSASQPAGYEK